MIIARRRFLHLAAAGATAALPALPRPALAQAYPSRPIRWVVPYPAGGATDLISRLLAQWLSERLGQQVIVDNRPGGGTTIGTMAVVTAPPDGYTLLFTASTHTINVSLQSLPFVFLRDITLVSGLSELPLVMDAGPKVPVTSLAELVSYAKANPGKVSMASFGAATISHLAIELFKVMTGADVLHVPYRGGAQMMTDLMSGQIQAAVDSLPSSLPHIRSGRIRGLALLSAQRSPVVPDIPIASEIIPGFEVRTFSGVGVPSGTPAPIIERLNKEINAGLADPKIKARFAEVGGMPVIMSSAQANAFVRAQTEKWAKLIKSAGIKAQ
jgi:tripartite-type tricarboxylate transporter receptor subunit TctC